MKFLILLLSTTIFHLASAETKAPKVMWLVAPAIWNQAGTEFPNYLRLLESYLAKAAGQPVAVEVKTAPGFMLEQYFYLEEQTKGKLPDWVVYLQRGDFYAKDLEELLASKSMPEQPFRHEKFSDEEIASAVPSWVNSISKLPGFSSVKTAAFFEQRLMKVWRQDREIETREDYAMYSARYISEILNNSLKKKTRLLFLVSPEQVKFGEVFFPENTIESLIARAYFLNIVIEKPILKEDLAHSTLDYVLLPKEYGELSQSENLVSGSNFVLNSTGVQRSLQLITPILSDYVRATRRK